MFRQSIRTVSRSARLINNNTTRRSYADVAAASDVLKLSLTLPHESLIVEQEVTQVNIPAASGDMGILANHVPIIEQLRPGVVEVIGGESGSTKYFVNGGFASVQPNGKLLINAVEAFKTDAFSVEAIKSQLAEAQKNVSSADEETAAEAAIQVEVLEALSEATK